MQRHDALRDMLMSAGGLHTIDQYSCPTPHAWRMGSSKLCGIITQDAPNPYGLETRVIIIIIITQDRLMPPQIVQCLVMLWPVNMLPLLKDHIISTVLVLT